MKLFGGFVVSPLVFIQFAVPGTCPTTRGSVVRGVTFTEYRNQKKTDTINTDLGKTCTNPHYSRTFSLKTISNRLPPYINSYKTLSPQLDYKQSSIHVPPKTLPQFNTETI